MPEFSAKDVQRLRQVSGAGMMDAKRALTECDGDVEAAIRWLREKGLGKASERSGRENVQGAVAVATADRAAALVDLKCETDFVAKSPDFVKLAEEIAAQVAADGEAAATKRADAIDDLRIKLKENIELGQVARFEAPPGHVIDTYLHVQSGRGVNGVLVELESGTPELAHDVAVHIAFGRPRHVTREEVPASEVEEERASLEAETRNEGKPDAAVPKIVDGRLNGWYKRVPGGVLVEQPYARDDKRTVKQVLGDAKVVRFAQAVIGA